MCVSLTTEFRTFEQTLQPVSYSFSLSLLITSSFVALSVGGKSGWFCSKHQFPVCFLYLYLDVNTSKCTCIYFWMNKTKLLGLKALVSKPTYLELILTIICVVNSIWIPYLPLFYVYIVRLLSSLLLGLVVLHSVSWEAHATGFFFCVACTIVCFVRNQPALQLASSTAFVTYSTKWQKLWCRSGDEADLLLMDTRDYCFHFNYLMVNPKEYRVVVIESLLWPTHFRNTLARVLFSHFGVSESQQSPWHVLFSIEMYSA